MDFQSNEPILAEADTENQFSFFNRNITTILNEGDGDGNSDDPPPAGTVTPPEEDDDDTHTGPKPFGDQPRVQSTSDQINIYALIVGINEYHLGEHAPSWLNGCLQDVMLMEDYLRRKYAPGSTALSHTIMQDDQGNNIKIDTPILPIGKDDPLPIASDGRLHICVLRDHQSTYDNIIRGFNEHLINATGNDTVFFHYSGHGAQQFTADEFLAFRENANGEKVIPPIVPEGKDQALVCFQNEDEDGNKRPLFLADKELAQLIHEVENNPRTKPDSKPHVVISLDCCHSGSGTRDFEEAPTGINPDFNSRHYDPKHNVTRATAEPGFGPTNKRRLEDYYGNYSTENLEIPESRHILLSACESKQLAGDTSRGGIYTTSLIATLNEAMEKEKDLHYGNLFTLCRAQAMKIQKQSNLTNIQNPQMDNLGGFDPFTCFLEGWQNGVPGRYEMFKKGEEWFVWAGAVHGLPTSENGKIKLKIFDAVDENRHIANAFAQNIGAQHSQVTLLEGQNDLPDGKYVAEILSLPAKPVYVWVHGNAADVAEVMNPTVWGKLETKNILHTASQDGTDGEPPRVSLEITDSGDIILRDLLTDAPFISYSKIGVAEQKIQEKLLDDLEKIAVWIRMAELENPDPKISKLYDVNLVLQDNNGLRTFYAEGEHVIEVKDDLHSLNESRNSDGPHGLEYNFEINLDKVTQDLYFYAYTLWPNCLIESFNDEEESGKIFFDAANINRTVKKLLKATSPVFGANPEDQKVTTWFKVIVTTEELDYHMLEQSELGATRFLRMDSRVPAKFTNTWAEHTFKVVFKK